MMLPRPRTRLEALCWQACELMSSPYLVDACYAIVEEYSRDYAVRALRDAARTDQLVQSLWETNPEWVASSASCPVQRRRHLRLVA